MYTAYINDKWTLSYERGILEAILIQVNHSPGLVREHQISGNQIHCLLGKFVVRMKVFRGTLVQNHHEPDPLLECEKAGLPWSQCCCMIWEMFTDVRDINQPYGWSPQKYQILAAFLLYLGLSVVLIAWFTGTSYGKIKVMKNVV